MNAENLILAGVWQGTAKPPMKAILRKVLEKIDHLYTEGICVRSSHYKGVKNIKAKLLIAVFDLPARAIATNFLQFNGCFSCLYCHDEGIHISHRQLFLPHEDHHPCSKATIEKHARKAEKKGRTIYGIKESQFFRQIWTLCKQFQWTTCMQFLKVYRDDCYQYA